MIEGYEVTHNRFRRNGGALERGEGAKPSMSIIDALLDRAWELCSLPRSQRNSAKRHALARRPYGRACMACASIFSAGKHCKRASCSPPCESELKREAMSWSGQINRLRAVAKRMKPQMACAACLHTVGFGYKRIKQLVGMNAPKWTRTEKHDPMRFNRHRARVAMESGGTHREALRKARPAAVVLWLSAWFVEHKAESEAWFEALRKRRMSRSIERQMERYRTDPAFKVKFILRKQLRKFVSGESAVDRNDMFGCTIQHLVQHLSSQFERGMNWSNHGRWHIDHIIPCASFNLLDIEEQKRCFHWTNLRPLWARENIIKSDTIKNAQLGLMLTIQ